MDERTFITITLSRETFWHQQDAIYDFCTEHFGKMSYSGDDENFRWDYSTAFGHGRFTFADPKDATFFKLVWLDD